MRTSFWHYAEGRLRRTNTESQNNWRASPCDTTGVANHAIVLVVVALVALYAGDGYQDLYLNNFGPNVLYRNNGDGTFTDVTH
jgi:hypothetical protein